MVLLAVPLRWWEAVNLSIVRQFFNELKEFYEQTKQKQTGIYKDKSRVDT
jgi:hypothetical protein